MVDNRAAGFYGIGGAFNFKSGDISGTAASLQDDKQGQGNEYRQQKKQDDGEHQQMNYSQFVDRSAQLNATLNSLAMLNVANVLNTKIKSKDFNNKIVDEEDIKPTKEEELIYRISGIRDKKRDF